MLKHLTFQKGKLKKEKTNPPPILNPNLIGNKDESRHPKESAQIEAIYITRNPETFIFMSQSPSQPHPQLPPSEISDF